MKTAMRVGLAVVVLLFLVVVALGTTIGSERGRLWLVDQGLQMAGDAGFTVELTELRTPSLGHWSVAGVQVYDQQNLLLEVEQLELTWQPWELLKRRLHITGLSAQQVDYYQHESEDDAPQEVEPGKMPQLPSSPLAIVLDRLNADTVTLHGMPLPASQTLPSYQIKGSARAFTDDAPLALQLEVESLSHSEDVLKISTSITNKSTVRIKGRLYERPQGLIGTLAHLPEKQPIDLTFELILQQQHEHIELAIEQLQLPLLGHQLGARGTLRYNAAQQTLLVKQMVLQTDKRRHLLEGGINAEDLWLELNAKAFPLDIAKPWVPDLESGSFSGQVQLHWLYRENGQLPEVKTRSEVELVYRQQHISAELDGQLKDGLVTFAPGVIGLEQARLHFNGKLDLSGARSDLQAELHGFSTGLLQPWEVQVPPSLAVSADSLALRLTGALQAPQLTLRGELEGRYQQQPFYLDIAVTGTTQQARFERLNLVAQTSELNAKGVLDWTGDETDISVDFDNLKHTLLQLAPASVQEQFPQELTFTAEGHAQVQGNLRKPWVLTESSISGQYELEGETLPYQVVAAGRAQIGTPAELDLDIQKLTLSLSGEPTVNIQGHYHQQSVDLRVQLMRLPTQILTALGQADLRGQAEADLQLSGDLKAPKLSGFVELRSAEATAGETGSQAPFVLRGDLSSEQEQLHALVNFTYDTQNVGNLHIQLPLAKYLQAQGPWQALPLDLQAQGNMDLSVISLFLDPAIHQLRGMLETDIRVQGTPAQPDFHGRVTLGQGYYHNAVYDTHARDIELLIEGAGETLVIKKARARSDGNGYIELDGRVDWRAQARTADNAVALTLRANQFILMQTRELYGEVSGKASLEGSFEELWLRGKLEVSPLHASIEAAIKTQIPTIEVTEIGEEDDEPRETLASQMPVVHLELTIEAGQQAYLRGRGLDTELAGRVIITGTAEDPQFVGRFRTLRGRLEIFGRRFVLNEGEVRFSNDSASLRIPAVYKTEGLEIRALIAGTADEPKLTLSSVPDLPQDELLARLIFGKSVQDITNPVEAWRLASAVNTLRSGGGFDPIGSARQLLGVDTLSFGNEETEEGSALTLGVGKYVNERVYVELKSSRNPAQPWQGNVQVELTPRLNLESGTSEDGANARLMWKKDY